MPTGRQTFRRNQHRPRRVFTLICTVAQPRNASLSAGGASARRDPRKGTTNVGIISWIILGLVAGVIAKVLLPGRDPGGLIGTTLIGVAGAFVGGWLSAHFLDRPVKNDFFDLTTWGAAIGGSLVLLIGYRVLFGNSRD
jgi:uncharacterized membrane protein YeaQ/YmgE (transglycosylase-associated protein family)